MDHRLSASLPLPEGFPTAAWSPKKKRRRRGAIGWAMCAATLFPLVRKPVPDKFAGHLPDWVSRQATHLHTLRSYQLDQLQAIKSPVVPGLRLCPPSFVDTPGSLKTCRSIWCPFCWGRLVAGETYKKMHRIAKEHYATHAVAEVTAFEYIPDVLDYEQVRLLISTAAHRVVAEANLASAPGLFKLTTVEPSDAGWRVTVRVIAFITLNFAKKFRPPTTPTCEVEYHRLYGMNHELAKLVGRVCVYPFELLFQPAEDVRRVLGLRDGLRLMTSSGLFRQRK